MVSHRSTVLVPVEHITQSILALRGQRVLLHDELAALYGAATKVLLQAVRRNRERFPDDFMIQLTTTEWTALRSQFVTSSAQRGGRRYLPYAFTEQGVAMLSSVLRSRRAITVNIQIMRAFVRMRELLASNRALARRLPNTVRSVSPPISRTKDSGAAAGSSRERTRSSPVPETPAGSAELVRIGPQTSTDGRWSMSLGNLSPRERWLSTLAGFGLALGAMPRGGWLRRLAFLGSGAMLVSRGATGYCGVKAAVTGESSLRSGVREQWQRVRSQLGTGAAGIDTLETLHLEEMQELASSTVQIGRLLDELERSIDHAELRRSVQSYATQIHSRAQDIERILTTRGASPRRHPDQGMQALVEEARKMMRIASPTVRDAALVDSTQRLIHYQIAAEGSAAAHAKALGRDQEAAEIAGWGDRDKAVDGELTELAKGLLNPQATERDRTAGTTVGAAGTAAGATTEAGARPH